MPINFMEKAKSVKSSDEIVRPPEAPLGSYIAQVKKIPDLGEQKSAKGDWETLTFQMQLLSPLEDVDASEVAAYGDLKSKPPMRRTFMFDKNDQTNFDRTMFALKTFLTEHLKCWPEGMGQLEAMNNSVNHQCVVFIRPGKPDQNGNVFHEIGKTAPLPE